MKKYVYFRFYFNENTGKLHVFKVGGIEIKRLLFYLCSTKTHKYLSKTVSKNSRKIIMQVCFVIKKCQSILV